MEKLRIAAFFTVLFILILSIFNLKMHYQINSTQTTLMNSYNNLGAEFVSSEIYIWGRIEENQHNISDLWAMAGDIFNKMGIRGNSELAEISDEDEGDHRFEMKGTTDDGIDVYISIKTGAGRDEGSESILSVSVKNYATCSSMEEAANIIKDAFENYHIKPVINTIITGSFPGRLDKNQEDDVLRRVIKSTGAKKIEGVRDKNLLSVSAYSPFIKESVKVKGKDVNLNLAIRYNSYESKTYIWLAAPVITTEY
jgi:hypothetical protein